MLQLCLITIEIDIPFFSTESFLSTGISITLGVRIQTTNCVNRTTALYDISEIPNSVKLYKYDHIVAVDCAIGLTNILRTIR